MEIHTMKIKPLPVNINDALAEEENSRLAVAAWECLEPDTQQIMLTSDPEMLYYVQYCKSVVDLVDSWRVEHET